MRDWLEGMLQRDDWLRDAVRRGLEAYARETAGIEPIRTERRRRDEPAQPARRTIESNPTIP